MWIQQHIPLPLRMYAPWNRATLSMGGLSWCHSPHKPSYTLHPLRHNTVYRCCDRMNTRHQGFNAYCCITPLSYSRSHWQVFCIEYSTMHTCDQLITRTLVSPTVHPQKSGLWCGFTAKVYWYAITRKPWSSILSTADFSRDQPPMDWLVSHTPDCIRLYLLCMRKYCYIYYTAVLYTVKPRSPCMQ